MKNWFEVRLSTATGDAIPLALYLIECGSHGVFTREKKESAFFGGEGLEERDNRANIYAYFLMSEDAGRLREKLSEILKCYSERNQKPIPDVSYALLGDESLSENWKSMFRTLRVGRRLVIKPSWVDYKPDTNDIVIELTAGLAFGTGTHPSTSLALKALEDCASSSRLVENANLLDVGCGSGILSIAGAKLGFAPVLGIDTDRRCIEVSQFNARLNRADRICSFQHGSVDSVTDDFSIIIANIYYDTLIEFKDSLLSHCRNDGYMILSGILESRSAEVERAYLEPGGVTPVRYYNEDSWVCMIFKKI